MHPLVFHPRSTLPRDTGLAKPAPERATVPKTDLAPLPPFDIRTLSDGTRFAISAAGEQAFLRAGGRAALLRNHDSFLPGGRAELAARVFLPNHGRNQGKECLLAARRAPKRETVAAGPSLHIIVPTRQCGHTCQYCQVSRAQSDTDAVRRLGCTALPPASVSRGVTTMSWDPWRSAGEGSPCCTMRAIIAHMEATTYFGNTHREDLLAAGRRYPDWPMFNCSQSQSEWPCSAPLARLS
jgi:hypothetical protein